MFRRKNIILLVILSVFAVVAVFAVIRRKRELASAESIAGRPVPVTVSSVVLGEYHKTRRYVGVVTPLNTAKISSRITSEVVEVNCNEGDVVKKGAVLIRLDARHLQQAVSSAQAKVESVKTKMAANAVTVKSLKASLAYWKKQFERDENLFSNGKIISDKQLDDTSERVNAAQGKFGVALQQAKTLQAEMKAAREAYDLAKTQLSYATLIAPFDATVADVPVAVGDLAAPGHILAILDQVASRTVDFKIPQVDMAYVEMGGLVGVRFRGKKAVAKITTIYPAVGINKMKIVEATMPPDADEAFVNGQYVDVYLVLGNISDALIVPSNALNEDNDSKTPSFVYVLKNGNLKRVEVKVTADNGKTAVVEGALSPGDEVVTGAFLGWAELADGLKAEKTN